MRLSGEVYEDEFVMGFDFGEMMEKKLDILETRSGLLSPSYPFPFGLQIQRPARNGFASQFLLESHNVLVS